MNFTIHCENASCGKAYQVGANLVGKRVKCSACGQVMRVPEQLHAFSGFQPPNAAVLPEPKTVAAASSSKPAVVQRHVTNCRFCYGEVLVVAMKCRHCGEWLKATADAAFSSTQIKIVSPINTVIFTIVTLGIYHLFWLHRVFKELHSCGATQTTPGKAVGFLFIPLFNLWWIFAVWQRLGDAIAHEFTNTGLPQPAVGVVWLAPIASLLGVVELAAPPIILLRLILLPIPIGKAQAWMNQLAASHAINPKSQMEVANLPSKPLGITSNSPPKQPAFSSQFISIADIQRNDQEMGEMYLQCPKCSTDERINDMGKWELKRGNNVFANYQCKKCGTIFDGAKHTISCDHEPPVPSPAIAEEMYISNEELPLGKSRCPCCSTLHEIASSRLQMPKSTGAKAALEAFLAEVGNEQVRLKCPKCGTTYETQTAKEPK